MPIHLLAMRFAARTRRTFPLARDGAVEAVLLRIERLNLERQRLRDEAAAVDALELNRLEIVRAQWDLSRALIERYLPRRHRNAA